ncbi:MAG: response regulator [Gammaproteobacteria bacterium]
MSETKPTVVVVDDSATVRAFFERIATDMGVNVHSFETAADAQPYLDGAAPDLVFLDIIMPDKDGLTFLQELRRDPRHRDTRFVVISSKDYAQDRATARDLGALDFVPKPVTTQRIQDLIARHTGVRPKGEGTG